MSSKRGSIHATNTDGANKLSYSERSFQTGPTCTSKNKDAFKQISLYRISLALTWRSNPNARGGFDVHACCCFIPNLLNQGYSGSFTKHVGSSRQAHLFVQNCSSDSDVNVVCEMDSAR
jgi:hypothetical protein